MTVIWKNPQKQPGQNDGHFVEAGLFRRGWLEKIRQNNFQCRRNRKSASLEKGEKRPSQDGNIIFHDWKWKNTAIAQLWDSFLLLFAINL